MTITFIRGKSFQDTQSNIHQEVQNAAKTSNSDISSADAEMALLQKIAEISPYFPDPWKLKKKDFMALQPGVYLVSNTYFGDKPIFAEIVANGHESRKAQWDRILAAGASQMNCRVFPSKQAYEVWKAILFR